MSLRDTKHETLSRWMKGDGPHADIVITSRARIARNVEGVPFPHRAQPEQLREIIDDVDEVLSRQKDLGRFKLIRIGDLSHIERRLLVEKHLISPQLAECEREAAVELREDEAISIMLNEEDHVRSQCIFPGLQLEKTLELNNQIDDLLEEELKYAFSRQFGYLTACPSNVGTGLRASIMVHLPALVLTDQINQLLAGINKLGLAVRGLYGEGTEALGNLYQISNQITLGQSEEEIIENIKGVAYQVIERENNARDMLIKQSKDQIADKVYRAYGILSNARIISSQEAMNLLSQVRLGIDLELIEDLRSSFFNELMVYIRPGYLQWFEREELSTFERDVKRASLIRKRLRESRRTK